MKRKARKYTRSGASAVLCLNNGPRIDPDILRSRVQEREQREAADNRTEAQRWLGDPEPWRSALAAKR